MTNFTDQKQLDTLIKQSLEIKETPSQKLNLQLKKELYKQKQVKKNIKETTERTVSFWFLPMILNFILFSLAAAFFFATVSNPCLLTFFILICIHASMAGILLTIIGLKRTPLKQEMSIRFKKRGIKHD